MGCMLKDSLLENTPTPAAAEWADIADSLVENCPTPVTVDDLFAETDSVDVVLDPRDAVRIEWDDEAGTAPANWLGRGATMSVPGASLSVRFRLPGDGVANEIAPSLGIDTYARLRRDGTLDALDIAAANGVTEVPATLSVERISLARTGGGKVGTSLALTL